MGEGGTRPADNPWNRATRAYVLDRERFLAGEHDRRAERHRAALLADFAVYRDSPGFADREALREAASHVERRRRMPRALAEAAELLLAAEGELRRAPWDDPPPELVEAHDRALEGYRRAASGLAGQGDGWSSPEALISTVRQTAGRCEKHTVFLVCGCRGRLIRQGCGSTGCVDCADRVTRRRGRRVFERLLASVDRARELAPPGLRSPSLWSIRKTVLTVPPEHRHKLLRPADVARIRRELADAFKRRLGAVFAMVVPHPVGDEDPDTFHPHFNVLWLAGARWREELVHGRKRLVLSSVRPVRGDSLDLAVLREVWADVLGVGEARMGGTSDPAPLLAGEELPERGPSLVVWSGFWRRTDERAIMHGALYFSRAFVAWGRWSPKWIVWYGRWGTPSARKLAMRCPCCESPFSILGEGARALARFEEWRAAGAGGPAPPAPCRGELVEGEIAAVPRPHGDELGGALPV